MTALPPRLRNAVLIVGIAVGSVAFGQLVSFVFADGHRFVPWAVQAQALTTACPAALFALGLVLIYRANRIINFAQTAFGGAGAIATLTLHQRYDIPWFLAMAAGIAGAAALAGLAEIVLIRRFSNATRLVLTVVTIGVAQLVTSVAPLVLSLIGVEEDQTQSLLASVVTPVSQIKVTWFPVVFTGDHFVMAAATLAALVGMAVFFRFTEVGIAVRATAENADRAQLLGVNTRTLATLVWGIAGILGGVAAVLQTPFQDVGNVASVGLGSGLLLRGLAAAVFGRFDNLPIVVVAALGLNVFEQSVFYAVGRTDLATFLLFVILLVGLVLQRKQLARAQSDESGTWASTEEIRPTPTELEATPDVRSAKQWVRGTIAVVVLAYPWVASSEQANLGAVIAIYGIVAISLVILIGWGGQISLGQWGIAAVGAVLGGALTGRFDWPFLPALVVASLAGAAVAILLGLPALRIRGLFLAVTTLAFTLVVSDLV